MTFSFLGVMKKGKEFEETLLVVNGEEQKFQIEDLIYDLRKKNNWFTNYFSAFNVGEIIHNRKFKTVFLLLKEDNSRNFYLVDDSGEFIDPLFLGNDRKETLGVLFSLFSYWNYVPSINKKYGLVSFDGDILVPFLYDKIKIVDQLFLSVELDKKQALINQNGKIITPFIYDSITKSNGDIIGYIDKIEHMIQTDDLNIVKSEAQNYFFESDIVDMDRLPFRVKPSSSQFLLKVKEEDYAFPYLFSDIKKIPNKNACIVAKENMYGLIDEFGEFPIIPKYVRLNYINDDLLLFEDKDGKWGVVNIKGEIVQVFDLDDVKIFLSSSSFPSKYFYLSYYDGFLECYIVPYLDDHFLGYLSLSGHKYWSNLEGLQYEMDYEEAMEWARLNGEYVEHDDNDFSSNPWDDVFGPGDESDAAYWNTRDE